METILRYCTKYFLRNQFGQLECKYNLLISSFISLMKHFVKHILQLMLRFINTKYHYTFIIIHCLNTNLSIFLIIINDYKYLIFTLNISISLNLHYGRFYFRMGNTIYNKECKNVIKQHVELASCKKCDLFQNSYILSMRENYFILFQ